MIIQIDHSQSIAREEVLQISEIGRIDHLGPSASRVELNLFAFA